jgi:hypothetical protein
MMASGAVLPPARRRRRLPPRFVSSIMHACIMHAALYSDEQQPRRLKAGDCSRCDFESTIRDKKRVIEERTLYVVRSHTSTFVTHPPQQCDIFFNSHSTTQTVTTRTHTHPYEYMYANPTL